MNNPTPILFVRQKHDAKRAGLHFDYRVVIGDKAFSWASKKEFPEIGKPTILWEQALHDATYATTPSIIIPEGQYGAGTQVIDYAQKGSSQTINNDYHLELNNGDRFLIKKAPEHYGEKAWLFLRKKALNDQNPYLEKVAALGDSDMQYARRKVNEIRVKNGEPEISHDDFEHEFKNKRDVTGRLVGGVLGGVVPILGNIAGYYVGKSVDNSNASEKIIHDYSLGHNKSAASDSGSQALEAYTGMGLMGGSGYISRRVGRKLKGSIAVQRSQYMAKAKRAGKPFSKEYMSELASGSATNVKMINRARKIVKGTKNTAILAGAGLVGHAIYRNGRTKKASESNVFLEKIASEKKKDSMHGWTRTGTVVGSSLLASAASVPVNLGLLGNWKKKLKGTSGVTEADVDSYRKKKNLRHVTRTGNASYDLDHQGHFMFSGGRGNKRPYVHAKSPDVAMHEYGHANNFNKYRKAAGSKGLKAKVIMHSLSQRSALGLGGLAGAYAATSDNKKARDIAPYAVAASTVPMLAEEARATLSPAKHLLKTRGAKVAKSFLKKMAPAYGTYVAAAGTAAGTAVLAKHFKNKAIEKANK